MCSLLLLGGVLSVKQVDSAIQLFYILLEFQSTYSIYPWERGFEICNFDSRFSYLSFQLWFCFMYFEALW